jgi:Transcriptional regulator PadR-like family
MDSETIVEACPSRGRTDGRAGGHGLLSSRHGPLRRSEPGYAAALHAMLSRLEHEKLVTSGWETPRHQGERPRKYYWLTGEGIRAARLELAHASPGRRRAAVIPVRPAPGSLG